MIIKRSCIKVVKYQKLNEPVTELIFVDNGTCSKEFSHSVDGVIWSEYESLADFLLSVAGNLFIRIKYTIENRYTLESISSVVETLQPTNIRTIDISESGYITRSTDQIFRQPKAFPIANKLRADIVDVITQKADYKCTYYRVRGEKPNVTLKTFESHTVFDVQELRVTFKDGTKASSRPSFSPFGYGYVETIDLEIPKLEFSRVFGEPETPKKGDYLKLELDGIMYQINTVHENRDIGNEAAWYDAILNKWEEKGSHTKSETVIEHDINDFRAFVDGVHATEQANEQKDAIGYSDTLNEPDNEINRKSDFVTITKHNNKRFYTTTNWIYETNLELENVSYATHLCIHPTKESCNILELYTLTDDVLNISIVDGFVVSTLANNTDTQTVTCVGTKLDLNTSYALFINRVEQDNEIYFMCFVYDSSLEVVQEITVLETNAYELPNALRLIGEHCDLGNIHVSDNYISNEVIKARLSNENSFDEYILIDTVETTLNGEKYTTKQH